jgi:hypothetical protein
LSGGAVEDTVAIGAELAGSAFISAGSTVFKVNFQIATDATTVG